MTPTLLISVIVGTLIAVAPLLCFIRMGEIIKAIKDADAHRRQEADREAKLLKSLIEGLTQE